MVPFFELLDHQPTMIVSEVLECAFKEDKDYKKLRDEEGLEWTIDPHRLGLIIERVVDPLALSSSASLPPPGPLVQPSFVSSASHTPSPPIVLELSLLDSKEEASEPMEIE